LSGRVSNPPDNPNSAYNMGPTKTKNYLDNDLELSDKYATAVLAAYQHYKNNKTKLPTF
jgi:hypothetical protein